MLKNRNAKRTATMIGKSDTHLAYLDRSDFVNALRDVEIQKQVKHLNFIKAIPLFSGINKIYARSIYLFTFLKPYKRGDIIYKEGD